MVAYLYRGIGAKRRTLHGRGVSEATKSNLDMIYGGVGLSTAGRDDVNGG